MKFPKGQKYALFRAVFTSIGGAHSGGCSVRESNRRLVGATKVVDAPAFNKETFFVQYFASSDETDLTVASMDPRAALAGGNSRGVEPMDLPSSPAWSDWWRVGGAPV